MTSFFSAPCRPPNDEKYTEGTSFNRTPLPHPQDEPIVQANDDEASSSTTTVEDDRLDGSSAPTVSDSESSPSIYAAGNNQIESEAAPVVSEINEASFENKSPSGASEQNSVFNSKFLTRSSPNLVSRPKQLSLQPFPVRVSVDTG
jgi:hypothetical protein